MKKRIFASLVLTTLLSACNSNTIQLNRIIKPTINKVSETNNIDVSQLTVDSYSAFAKKFTSLMMEVNNKNENSLAISIPDAYLCLAILGAISSDSARNDVLSYLELNDMSELRTSVRELVSTLMTLFKDREGKLVGGFNLNSIWLNPDTVSLKEKDEELYNDLKEIFDASIYLEGLTSEKANQYLKENGLKGMPTPEIDIGDDPYDLSVMSTCYCLDYFKEIEKREYLNEYKSGNHKIDYYYDDQVEKVNYINKVVETEVYEGSNFHGSRLPIGALGMDLFLPDDKEMMPSEIMDDVLSKNYQFKEGTYTDSDGTTGNVKTFEVNIKAPYFSLDNSLTLRHEDLIKELPIIACGGAAERLAQHKAGAGMFLDSIQQFSVMKFNYDGFYSCSTTIAGVYATSPIQYQKFDLTLDHPYIFQVSKMVRVDGKSCLNLPIVIGEIVNPDYKD